MNVHNAAWLPYSSGTSPEGRELQAWCLESGFEERVRKPTRGNYLLDLCLTDMGSKVRANVVAGISDHDAVFGSILFPTPKATIIEREVFLYNKANWTALEGAMGECDWELLFERQCGQCSRNIHEHNNGTRRKIHSEENHVRAQRGTSLADRRMLRCNRSETKGF